MQSFPDDHSFTRVFIPLTGIGWPKVNSQTGCRKKLIYTADMSLQRLLVQVKRTRDIRTYFACLSPGLRGQGNFRACPEVWSPPAGVLWCHVEGHSSLTPGAGTAAQWGGTNLSESSTEHSPQVRGAAHRLQVSWVVSAFCEGMVRVRGWGAIVWCFTSGRSLVWIWPTPRIGQVFPFSPQLLTEFIREGKKRAEGESWISPFHCPTSTVYICHCFRHRGSH